jgi:ring-1,2-phenylacetyl-CoA epoxidase subunit PaaE
MSATTPRFHSLRIADVRRETPDAVSITFEIPDALRPAYAFRAGQYLTLRATLEGEELRRSYSICTCPEDGELRIGIKQMQGGIFSTWANTALRPGDAIDVMSPTGRFGLVHDEAPARVHVGFASGSGITPVLSILRGVLARDPHAMFFLFYGNRSSAEMLFREALDDLKDRYLSRLSVFHVLSQERQDLEVLNGRLDADKVRHLLRHLVPAASIDHAYVCGPAGMSETIEATLRDLGLPEARIHVERFTSVLSGRPQARKQPVDAASVATATLIVDGKRSSVPVAEGEAVLDAALRAGLDLPFACKGGMCSTCRARVVEGSVTMDVNYSLEPWELAAGFVLTCQAHPTGDHVVIDYDEM